uniref:Uncharacterized protein n=1 Tax=Rhipicephalus microplus TaxID=6941 RepID=A0A6G5A215_RHIMP
MTPDLCIIFNSLFSRLSQGWLTDAPPFLCIRKASTISCVSLLLYLKMTEASFMGFCELSVLMCAHVRHLMWFTFFACLCDKFNCRSVDVVSPLFRVSLFSAL